METYPLVLKKQVKYNYYARAGFPRVEASPLGKSVITPVQFDTKPQGDFGQKFVVTRTEFEEELKDGDSPEEDELRFLDASAVFDKFGI